MKTKTVEDIFEFKHWDSKIVMSTRCNPSLGQRVMDDAASLGLNVSQTIEIRLANFYEKKDVVETLCERQEKISAAAGELQHQENIRLLAENEALRKESAVAGELQQENIRLLAENEVLKTQTAFLSHPILVSHLAQLKGKTDVIDTPGGKLSITYETPADVLTVLLYSFKLKP